jgi:predicted transcriptional regulator
MLLYTNIIHPVRKKFKLTCNEYVLLDIIYHLSNNPESKVKGWCYASKETLAQEIGISRQSICNLIDKLINKGLIEKDELTRFLKTKTEWNLVYLNIKSDSNYVKNVYNEQSKEDLHDVKKVYNDCKESLQVECKESLHNNNTFNTNNNTNKFKADKSANYDLMVEVYFDFYQSMFNFKPTFQAVDGKMIKEIENKIIFLCKQRNLETKAETIKASFYKVLDYASKDKWLKENFLLKNINSQFNKIINYGTKQEGQRIELDEETAKYFG